MTVHVTYGRHRRCCFQNNEIVLNAKEKEESLEKEYSHQTSRNEKKDKKINISPNDRNDRYSGSDKLEKDIRLKL